MPVLKNFSLFVSLIITSGIVLVGGTAVYAATYTYTHTVPASDLGKYELEYITAGANDTCYNYSASHYDSKAQCESARSAIESSNTQPGFAVVAGSCGSPLSKTTYTRNWQHPFCSLPSGVTVAAGGAGDTPGGNAGEGSGGGLTNPLKVDSLADFLRAILRGVVQIGAIFLTFMIVYVGFLFVAARGNEEKIRSAREALVWTVIGGLILLGAEAISLVIENTVKTL